MDVLLTNTIIHIINYDKETWDHLLLKKKSYNYFVLGSY